MFSVAGDSSVNLGVCNVAVLLDIQWHFIAHSPGFHLHFFMIHIFKLPKCWEQSSNSLSECVFAWCGYCLLSWKGWWQRHINLKRWTSILHEWSHERFAATVSTSSKWCFRLGALFVTAVCTVAYSATCWQHHTPQLISSMTINRSTVLFFFVTTPATERKG